jgi:hypothetical protein
MKKTAGCNGCSDAGAASIQTIRGKGALEFIASETTSLRFLGLGTDTKGRRADKIRYAFTLRPGGIAEVREHASYRADTRYVPGDVLRISVDDGVVTYRKNGALVYRSKLSVPPKDLRALTALYSASATLTHVTITAP